LRCFLAWCAGRGLDPLAASRVHLELYIRSMQEVRRFKPSTVIAGFYRTAVIDQIAARHADPRTTMRYDRARSNLDRHPRVNPSVGDSGGTAGEHAQLHPGRVHGLRYLTGPAAARLLAVCI
jgi:hypothetical protein